LFIVAVHELYRYDLTAICRALYGFGQALDFRNGVLRIGTPLGVEKHKGGLIGEKFIFSRKFSDDEATARGKSTKRPEKSNKYYDSDEGKPSGGQDHRQLTVGRRPSLICEKKTSGEDQNNNKKQGYKYRVTCGWAGAAAHYSIPDTTVRLFFVVLHAILPLRHLPFF
jgi:hypothetical protein